MPRTISSLFIFLVFSVGTLLFAAQLTAQQPAVTGRVVDEANSPLIGVSIQHMHTNCGTVTDLDGTFSITCPPSNGKLKLRLRYTGFASQIITARPGDSLGTITLVVDAQLLEEVVVTGYAVQRKRAMTASVSNLHGRHAGYGGKPQPKPGISFEPRQNESYNHITENGFTPTGSQPVSTLSTDVDRASYANVRRFLTEGTMPPADAVRSEEMINYFNYDDPAPTNGDPLAITTELAACPWNAQNRLLRVGLRAQDIDHGQLPAANLTFLLDVSGSMNGPDRLGLLKQSLLMLTERMRPQDRVSIVVYAGAAGLVLPSTAGNDRVKIEDALNNLSAGGSTAGGAGIELAYNLAKDNFIQGGNNRVILATDGDFNVGLSSQKALVNLIERKRETGIYLTVLSFGRGNYQDGTMQELADRGNGNHAYIDGTMEARKVLVEEFGGTLVTVAKDVKVQIEFDSSVVASYRLVGYENRLLNEEDFDDDTKDAGEMGAGHRVTVLYELVPAAQTNTADVGEVRIRYKPSGGGKSTKRTQSISGLSSTEPSNNLAWSATVAEFSMLLRDSEHTGSASWSKCLENARAARGGDPKGYREQMIGLIELAQRLSKK